MGLASLRESNYSRRIVFSSVPKIHMSPNLLLVFVPGDRRCKAKKDSTTQKKTKAGHDSLMTKHSQLRFCHASPDSSFLQERFARATTRQKTPQQWHMIL